MRESKAVMAIEPDTPHAAIAACLADLSAGLGAGRAVTVLRELTKMYQQVRRGDLATLAADYGAEAAPKGEIVIVIGRTA